MFFANKKVWKYLRYGLILLSLVFLLAELFQVKTHFITHKSLLIDALFSKRVFWLIPVIVLLPINWLIEAVKWRLVLRKSHSITLKNAFKSVLAGTSTGVISPNRVGEFAGRILLLPENIRSEAIGLNFVCSFTQLWSTILFGTIAVGFYSDILHPGTSHQIAYGLITLLGIALLFSLGIFIFKIKWLADWLMNKGLSLRLNKYFQALSILPKGIVFRLMAWSILRYLVFLTQQLMVLKFLSFAEFPMLEAASLVAMVYFFATLIPVNNILELGIRSGATLHLWGMAFPSLAFVALIASLLIWMLNVALPAIAGNVILLKYKNDAA